MPGPASSEEDRPPTNPAIRVRLSLKQMDISFASGKNIMRDPYLFERYLQRKSEGAIYWKGKRTLHSPSERKGIRNLKKLVL